MNVLGLVFSLMLILSYTFFATWEKQTASNRLRATYLGHERANRKILNRYESELYSRLRAHQNTSPAAPAAKEKPTEAKSSSSTPKTDPKFNEECAQLNLWPLVQEGREKHKALYEVAVNLLSSFYTPSLLKDPRQAPHFLNALIHSAKDLLQKKETLFALEKIDFHETLLQRTYYRMLKGTKGEGPPSLLDYVKIEPSEEKICLYHAHPRLLEVLFGPAAADRLFAEIHQEKAPPITKELIERICLEAHRPPLSEEFFDLLELGRPSHKDSGKKTFIAEDAETHVSLRKNLSLS